MKAYRTAEEEATTLPPALHEAVDAAYAAFQHHGAPAGMLDVCMPCCVDETTERELRRLPLRQLTARHFYEYNGSAKSSEQPADELLYFLPRMLDLLAQGKELHHSTELYLDRLGNCRANALSPKERSTVQAFALAFFREGLGRTGPDASPFDGANAFDILLMFHKGGVDVQPLLAHWLCDERPNAVLHYADASYWDFWGKHEIQNAFAEDQPEFREAMKAWLLDAGNRKRFAQKILAMDMGAMGPSAHCTCGNCMGPRQILEAVFDVISE
ncbi:MAG: hypothetical protein V4679_01345 [Pseudomonadota bacterium]